MNERARKAVAPVRLNVLVPLVLGTLAGACFLVSAVVLGSITQARGPIEEHLPRIGALMLASFGGMLALFAAAWAILHLWVVRPIQILTGEAETLALTQQNRGVLMPSRHALERLPRAVEQLAQKLAAARAGTAEAIAGATQRAEEQKSWLEAILLDLTEGIIVCNLEHRILLYNQAAARILNMHDALGLGRSVFGLLTGEPILQTLELLQQTGQAAGKTGPGAAQRASEQQSHRFVCATVDVGTLLETRLSLVRQLSGARDDARSDRLQLTQPTMGLARRARAPAPTHRPACAQARLRHLRTLDRHVFQFDAHPREATRKRVPDHSQLPAGDAVQHP